MSDRTQGADLWVGSIAYLVGSLEPKGRSAEGKPNLKPPKSSPAPSHAERHHPPARPYRWYFFAVADTRPIVIFYQQPIVIFSLTFGMRVRLEEKRSRACTTSARGKHAAVDPNGTPMFRECGNRLRAGACTQEGRRFVVAKPQRGSEPAICEVVSRRLWVPPRRSMNEGGAAPA